MSILPWLAAGLSISVIIMLVYRAWEGWKHWREWASRETPPEQARIARPKTPATNSLGEPEKAAV